MKEDAPVPDKVPTKRRQLHDALDRWLAVWASRDLTKRERQLVEEEQARRRALNPTVAVGVLVPDEGVTPYQLFLLREWIAESQATEVHHVFNVSSRVHTACRSLGVPVLLHDTPTDVVRHSTTVVAAPKETRDNRTGVWEWVRYARHRKVAVQLLLHEREKN